MIPDAYIESVFRLWEASGEECERPIAGNCMAPMLREGDVLTIRFGNRFVRTGDIVVYSLLGRLLVHRVLRRTSSNGEERFLVASHADPANMRRVDRGQILGKVTRVAGSNGRLSLSTPYWRAVNLAFAGRSYVLGKSGEMGGPFWRAMNLALRVKWKMFPTPESLKKRLWKGICQIGKGKGDS